MNLNPQELRGRTREPESCNWRHFRSSLPRSGPCVTRKHQCFPEIHVELYPESTVAYVPSRVVAYRVP
jgi:hypothetical protein